MNKEFKKPYCQYLRVYFDSKIRIGILLGIFFHFGFCTLNMKAQQYHELKVFFLYGSKPAAGYKKTEPNLFGGLHGGHVSISIDSLHVSFHHVKGYHIISKKKHFMGTYERMRLHDFLKDTATNKYMVIQIPLDSAGYQNLTNLIGQYLTHTPYDYAFIGMRCAAATYDMLSHAGLFKIQSKTGMVCHNFYPKCLRKKVRQLALKNHYTIRLQPGRISRKWEKD